MDEGTTSMYEDAGGGSARRGRPQHVAGGDAPGGAVVNLERLKQMLRDARDAETVGGEAQSASLPDPKGGAGPRGKHGPAQHRAGEDQIWLL